jgi:protein-S-isoprenylcysteine O-methyltransferase Ste14
MSPKALQTYVLQLVAVAALLVVALFVPAGNWAWAAGWLWLFVFLGCFLGISLWLFRYNPSLQEERLRMAKSDQPLVDRLLYPALFCGVMIWLGLTAFDSERLHASPLPLALRAAGLVILLAAFYLLYLVFRANTYLSTLVRVQRDRGHQVISTGPYAWVRHPMYAAMLAFFAGTALVLNSWHSLLLALVLVALLGWRALLEERLLRENLSGYAEYMTRVRFRLIPSVW